MDMGKICTKCKIEKVFSEFYIRTKSNDGLRPECKTCTKISQKSYRKSYYIKHIKEIKVYNKKHLKENRDYNKAWQKINHGKTAAKTAKRKSTKLQATPKWLSVEQKDKIEQFYIDAHEFSWLSEGGLEVDHIVPLQGKEVCGLHVPWNLQILPVPTNRSKGNRL